MTRRELGECLMRFGVACLVIAAFVIVGALFEWIAHG